MIEESSSELRERRIQVGRFYHTLSVLLRHEGLKETRNKANVIMFNSTCYFNWFFKICFAENMHKRNESFIYMIMLISLDERSGFVLADVLIKAIKEDLHVESFKEGMVCVIFTIFPISFFISPYYVKRLLPFHM